jgi:hypothetical protein
MYGVYSRRWASTESDQPRWLRRCVGTVCDFVDSRAGWDLASTVLVLGLVLALAGVGTGWLVARSSFSVVCATACLGVECLVCASWCFGVNNFLVGLASGWARRA